MNITFETVTLEGFGPFKDKITYPLGKRGTVLLRGKNLDDPGANSNGAGKTTLLMSPLWALTGEGDPRPSSPTNKKGLSKELVNESMDRCEVTCTLKVDGVPLEVTRSMGKGGHDLSVKLNGEDRTELEVAMTQEVINGILPTHLLKYAIFFCQHDVSGLLDMTDKGKKDLLGKVIDLEIWNKASDVAAARLKEAKSKADELRGMIEGQRLSVEKAQKGLDSAIADHEKWLANFNKEKAERGATVWEIGDLSGTFDSINDEDRQAFQIVVDEAKKPPKSFDDKLSGLRVLEAQVKAELDIKFRKRDELTIYANQIKEAGRALAQGGQTCNACGQPIQLNPAEVQRRLQVLKDDLGAARNTYRDFSKFIKETETQLADVRQQIAKAQSSEGQERAQYEKQYAVLQERAAQIARLQQDVNLYLQWCTRTSPYEISIKSFKKMLQDMADQGSLQEELDKCEEEASQYHVLRTAFGRSGIQSYVMESAVGDLGSRVAEYLNKISSGYLRLEVKPQSKTSKGDLREKISFVFKVRRKDGTYQDRSYKQLSGGQRRRCAMVMAMAFADFVMERTGITTNLIALDEILQHLDADGKDLAKDMLLTLDRESVFVISHDAEFGSQFDSIDMVTLEGDKSHVSIGVDA